MKQINKNLVFLIQTQQNQSKRGAVLEGSSRSGKTFSSVDFVIWIGANIGSGYVINIVKETYNSFKTTLYSDFKRRLTDFGLPHPFDSSREVPSLKILGNQVNFIGADNASKAHGMSCDFLWVNEGLDITREFFDQVEMRCRIFWWMDYNPKVTSHWVYNYLIPRDDVAFLHSTFKDNPFVSDVEKNKILSYEDTEDNRRQGTVDAYKWKVYGKGIRAAMEGLVHPDVIWIPEWPAFVQEEAWGLDFGYSTDPSALVRGGVCANNLYLKKYLYRPTPNSTILGKYLDICLPQDAIVWADSADPGMITDLKVLEYPVYAINKFRGSVNYGNGLLNRFKLHIVADQDFRIEQENYKYRVVNGLHLNEPEDKYNHLWDASRYLAMGSFMYWMEK